MNLRIGSKCVGRGDTQYWGSTFVTNRTSRRDFLMGMSTLPLLAMQMTAAGKALKGLGNLNAGEKPNILVLVFDTLSAPHTTLQGYERGTTPNLSRFAEQANVYHQHYAGGNFTSAGTASLLTGTYPWTHRALHLHGTVLEENVSHNLFQAFDDSYYKIAYTHNLLVTSLLHQFRQKIDHFKKTRELCLSDLQYSDRIFPNDYHVAFHGEWQNFRGGGKGFPGSLALSFADRANRFVVKRLLEQQYGEEFPRGVPSLHSLHFILEDVIDWLIADLASLPQPFLAYVHVLPPHEPYSTRTEFVNVFKGDGLRPVKKPVHFASEDQDQASLITLRREYDEYMIYADAEFGRLYDDLQRRNLLDDLLLVVTSDHGQLFERGIHGHVTPALYEPITRVPLLIKRPGQATKQEFSTPTSCVDLLPSLLAATQQQVPEWSEGRILPGFQPAQKDKDGRPVFTVEAKSNPKLAPLNKATIAMVKDDYKLINNRGYGEEARAYELYNLSDDPEETQDLIEMEKGIASSLIAELEEKLHQVDEPYL